MFDTLPEMRPVAPHDDDENTERITLGFADESDTEPGAFDTIPETPAVQLPPPPARWSDIRATHPDMWPVVDEHRERREQDERSEDDTLVTADWQRR